MKKFIVFISIIIFLSLTGIFLVYYALNSPRITEKFLAKIAVPVLKGKGLQLKSCEIAEQEFDWPGYIVFQGVECRFVQDEKHIDIKVEKLELRNFQRIFINASDPVIVSITDLSAQRDERKINRAQAILSLYFRYGNMIDLNGWIKVPSLQSEDIEVMDIITSVKLRDNTLFFDPLTAKFEGTAINGNFVLEYSPQLSYSMKISFKKLMLEKLAEKYPAVFTKVKGFFSGVVNVSGRESGISLLHLDLDSSEGAEVQAQLLAPVLQYIPKSRQHLMLAKLIKHNDFVFFETTKLNMANIDSRTIRTAIDMKSKAFNLDLNLTIDLQIDEGMAQILEAFKRFSQ